MKPMSKTEAPTELRERLAVAVNRSEDNGSERSVLGPRVRIVGRLESVDCVEIRGMIDGDIDSTMLIIGEGGRVDGFISADAVHIAGTVTGRIEAITVTIAKSATVIGAIIHNSLEIEKGATLDGPRPWRPMSFMAELRPI
ncbi:MAG: polymer-forming cytoskeletal protein [Inquilinus sp.]|nr:polymer-forming cytoskeletal protein [Inquilinus sp.]